MLHEQRLQMAVGEAPVFSTSYGPYELSEELLLEEEGNPRVLEMYAPHFGPFLSEEEMHTWEKQPPPQLTPEEATRCASAPYPPQSDKWPVDLWYETPRSLSSTTVPQ